MKNFNKLGLFKSKGRLYSEPQNRFRTPFQRDKDRIIHIHCKDMREDILNKSLEKDWSFRKAFLEGAFTVPGDGCIDYKPLLKYLKNIDYKGWLVVEAEQDPAKANPLEYAKKGFKYLSEVCADIDLKIAL